jgi:serine/threonine protein kinase
MHKIMLDRMGGVFPLVMDRTTPRKRKGSFMPVAFNIGDIIDLKFKVVDHLGHGGMGAVVKVMRLKDKKIFALKYCTENEEELLKRFAREVRIMQGISHPHVISVEDANLDFRPPYFLMPLADHSLQDEIDDFKTDEDKALDAFEQMCFGVQAIHNSSCVHRDIKPLNALRFADGRIAVSDLGLAKLDQRDTTTITQTNVLLGTRPYCAPEQLLPGGSREADRRTDIFQLGKALYEMMTGKSPALIDVTALPPGLKYIVQKATRENPVDRYQSIGSLMDAIKSYRLSKDPAQHPRETFENMIGKANELLKQNQYNPAELKQMIDILADGIPLAAGTIIDLFAAIPKPLLRVMVSDMPDEAIQCLEKYARSVKDAIGTYDFAKAELVADRMKEVFNASKNAEIKKFALLAILYAAVTLNRYAAMDVFDELLRKVKDPGDAVPIAEALQDNAAFYKKVAERIPADQLNAAVRAVRNEVLK